MHRFYRKKCPIRCWNRTTSGCPGGLSYPRAVLKVHVAIGMLQKSFLKIQFKERGEQEPHKKKKSFKMSHSEI